MPHDQLSPTGAAANDRIHRGLDAEREAAVKLVEKMARAIADHMCCDPEKDWPLFELTALAALKAMREPSEAMVDAGYASPGWDDTGCSDRGDASNCFTAMIDAAIKEAEGE